MTESRYCRRDFLLLAGAVGGAAVLAACGPAATAEPVAEEPAEEGPAEAPPPEKKEVVVWFPAGDTADCVKQIVMDSYNEMSEIGVVDMVQKPDHHDIVYSAVAAGVGPDVFPTEQPSRIRP